MRSYKIRVIKTTILEQRYKKLPSGAVLRPRNRHTHVWSIQCVTEEAPHIMGERRAGL